jgi:hypothetical protein
MSPLRISAAVCATALLLAGGGAVETSAVGAADELAPFSRHRAMTHVRKLARGIGVRVRATRGERRGARYIAGRFKDLGYRVAVREFSVDGGKSRNVVAEWPGSIKYPLIVGAHMDTVPRSPGANDNASGVAVILETARLVAGRSQAEWVKFVAFGSEEYGRNGRHHVGSQIYVNRLSARGRRRTPGMISVDMVADGRPLIVGTAGIGPENVARSVYRKIRGDHIGARYRTTCDCSDNGPFERAGIPGTFLWSGWEADYHSPSDRVGNMSPRDLRRSGRAVRAVVKDLRRRLIRRFRER